MIENIINFSFEQKLINHKLEKIENEKKLIKLEFNKKKYIIYFYKIEETRKGRSNKEERTIQISPRIKKQIYTYVGDEYVPVILGYDIKTLTFSLWEFNVETNTMQSLYTRSSTLNNAHAKGFDFYYYKKKNAFDRFKTDERSWSFSFNCFLFPLVLQNYNIIFTKEVEEVFAKKIKSFNKPYDLDELIMCLDLYVRKTKNINKKDGEIIEISDLCAARAKLLNYMPLETFYPDSIWKKFRNINGIYKKLQNFSVNDPSYKKKGLSGGSKDKQQIVWNKFQEKNKINKELLFKTSNIIKNKIKSSNIYLLSGYEDFSFIKDNLVNSNYIFKQNILVDFDFKKIYEKRIIDQSNFADPIKYLNELDKANELHEEILKKLSKILNHKNLIHKCSKHIDLYSEFMNIGKLFEAKTFNEQNLKRQIRHGVIQLKEYYFFNSNYEKNIKSDTDLFLILNENPLKFLTNKFIDFLKHEQICLCWFENKTISTLDTTWNREKISWLL